MSRVLHDAPSPKARMGVEASFLWFLLPTLLQTLLGVGVMVPLTTYYLDPADLGTVAILTAFAMLVTPLATTGDNWVLSSHWHATSEADRKELLFNLLLANLGMKVCWATLFWLAAPLLLPRVIRDYRPEYHHYFGLALLGLVAGTFWPTLSALMVIERAPVSHAVNESLQWSAGALTTVIGLVVAKLGVLALFLAPIAAGLMSMGHGLWYGAGRVAFRPSRRWGKEIMRTGLPAVPFAIMDVLSNSLDRFVIQRWLDLSTLGIYAHSQSYRGMFVTMTKAYSRTMTPTFLELFAQPKAESPQQVEQVVSLWYLCVTAGGIVVTLFAPEVIHLLTHGKFDRAAELVPIWFLLVLAHTAAIPYTQYLLTVRQNVLLSWSSVGMSVVTMVMVCVATWQFGVLGATGAAVAGSFALHGIRFLLARRFGCPYGLEPGLLWGLGIVLGVYLLTYWVGVPFTAKLLLTGVVVATVLVKAAPFCSNGRWATLWPTSK
ncbi:MAG: lipopolysaccharide biosynthesis protein [Nitrospira sp.]|nr:MAG: lipopolysaccharide biosynthesis protein [Nitrospira sp.]